jgi:beta-glucosidase/6-phospho-beta-glucosidase/beta-galactosidase
VKREDYVSDCPVGCDNKAGGLLTQLLMSPRQDMEAWRSQEVISFHARYVDSCTEQFGDAVGDEAA